MRSPRACPKQTTRLSPDFQYQAICEASTTTEPHEHPKPKSQEIRTLTEAVLETAGEMLQVAHATSAGGLSSLALDAPVVCIAQRPKEKGWRWGIRIQISNAPEISRIVVPSTPDPSFSVHVCRISEGKC
ncbi:hypothetical protein BC936DRAFT_148956 [Jimgerdemannia flammicorona]|uniref:Uncharacterized protein n=1 Tax=Jimgerdemannia flammicorona TaxID=994334 RepID=A0A433D1X3_9FUNG|nr:hypothetical protein BC936DRAFT_148956 [Jimgerdemannia flammicorona]